MDTSGFNNIEDLLADPTFPQYCMGTDAAAVARWTQWLKEHPEHKSMVDKARELYFFLNGGNTRVQYEKDRDQFLLRLKQHTEEPQLFTVPEKPVISRRKVLRRSLLALAVVAAAVVLVWNYRSAQHSVSEAVFHTKAAEKKQFRLPDGSSILLNSSSTVTVAAGFNEHNRDVYLSGEGFFEVTHNAQHPFIVHTHSIIIRVLGTVFNVKAYPNDTVTATSLLQGAIKVYANKDVAGVWLPKEGLLLSANQKLQVLKGMETKAINPLSSKVPVSYQLSPLANDATLNTVVETDWTRGRLSFNDLPFDRIALELERWYGVKIIFENEQLKQYRFVATFDKENIDQVLRALQATSSFNYRKEQDTIILY